MNPEFTEINRQIFYGKVWPRIKDKVEAIVSNLNDYKANKADMLMIQWGYKDKETDEAVILAVTHSNNEYEKHWVNPKLLVR